MIDKKYCSSYEDEMKIVKFSYAKFILKYIAQHKNDVNFILANDK